MRWIPLDGHTADRLLDGRVEPGDAPPGCEHVARLVRAARGPATVQELAGERQVVATLAAAVSRSRAVSDATPEGRRSVLTKLLTAKVLAATVTAVLGGGAAAAATGALPASFQTPVSHGLADIGISVPSPTAHPSDRTGDASSRATAPVVPPAHAVGPTLPGPAAYGLCTASTAPVSSDATAHSVAMQRLAAAAEAAGQSVTQFCAAVAPPSTVATTEPESSVPESTSPKPEGPPETEVPGRSDQAKAGDATGANEPSGTTAPVQRGTGAGTDSSTSTDSSTGTDSSSGTGTSSGSDRSDAKVGSSGTTTTSAAGSHGDG